MRSPCSTARDTKRWRASHRSRSRRVSVRVVEPRAAAPEPRVAVTLAQALLKSDKMDRVIRDAVMLGVSAVQPFVSRRTDVPLSAVAQRGPAGSVGSDGHVVGQAMRPRGRATSARDQRSFDESLQSTARQTRVMFVEPGQAIDVADMTSLEGQRPPSEAIVLIGPEGGWDPQEIGGRRGRRRHAAVVRRTSPASRCGRRGSDFGAALHLA